MAKYIEQETLIEFVKQNTPHYNGETTMECVERAIINAPISDAIEVVRCGECTHWLITGHCILSGLHRRYADFCSYGERSDNNAE